MSVASDATFRCRWKSCRRFSRSMSSMESRGAERSYEILRYGGMGHTAGVHTRSREAAVRFGSEMPASRITVNTPTTHGAIGFSTALPPSMTLGCGSWGGNVTSDNVSPLHLMDIKRVAFETRPVKSTRPAASARRDQSQPAQPAAQLDAAQSAAGRCLRAAGKINREEIAAIVDRFLAGRRPEELEQSSPAPPPPRPIEAEAGSMYSGPSPGVRRTATDAARQRRALPVARIRLQFGPRASVSQWPQAWLILSVKTMSTARFKRARRSTSTRRQLSRRPPATSASRLKCLRRCKSYVSCHGYRV